MEKVKLTLYEKELRKLKDKGSASDSSGRLVTNGYININKNTLKCLKSLGRTKE